MAAGLFVEQIEDVPGNQAVDGQQDDEPPPVRPGERLEAGLDEGVVEQRGGGDKGETEQSQPRNQQRIELDEARALAPFRFGGIYLQIEGAAETHFIFAWACQPNLAVTLTAHLCERLPSVARSLAGQAHLRRA